MPQNNNPIQVFMNELASMNDLENEITKRLKGTLEIMQSRERVVSCAFEPQHYRMRIYVDENEYTISVQGRGSDINKYLPEMFDILKSELK